MEILRHLASIVLLPGLVTLAIPGAILLSSGAGTLNRGPSAHGARVLLAILGMACVVAGLTLMVATIRLFAAVGRGTLAPWDPTRHLVVRGVYRHVRNPMISGVLFVLLGESALSASWPMFGWFLLFAAINTLYIPLSEEPGLVGRFGEDYLRYKQNVPRWFPRLTPWSAGA